MNDSVPKSKVLLISPYPDSGLTDMKEPPHGLAYIAACLRSRGYTVEALDAKYHCLKSGDAARQAVKKDPDIVGITAMTPDIVWAAKIADGIKALRPDIPIVVGGPHPTALPETTLDEFPSFDVAVAGEGEFPMLELADSVAAGAFPDRLAAIKGIAFRKGDSITLTPAREPILDLDALPFPAWDLFPIPRNGAYPIYATRGCSFGCKFCQRVLGSRIRRRSVDNTVKEIEWLLASFAATGFWFADETFGANRRWTFELLDRMIQSGIASRVRWHAQTRVDLSTEELFVKMKEAGCDGVALGVESGNQDILIKTGKKIKKEDSERAVVLAKKVGLKTRSFFILGHPYETTDTIRDTIDFAAKLNTDFISFAVMVPYPGTEVWTLARNKQAGYSYVSENWDDYRKHLAAPLGFASIPASTLRNLDKKAYVIFYLRNHRWLDFLRFMWGHRASIEAYLRNRIRDFLVRSRGKGMITSGAERSGHRIGQQGSRSSTRS